MLKTYIQQRYKNNQMSRDQRSLQEIIESLETFSRHLQCVVLNTIKTSILDIDDTAIQETIERLKHEKEKMKQE